jgi:hypothetical protein
MSGTFHGKAENEPVAETFEAELQSIAEKGKDLKGEQKVFYNSIVERVANNVQVLADLRKDHSDLRGKLREVVEEKATKNKRVDLPADLKHAHHEVNLLKRQIDRVKRDKEETIHRQRELEVIRNNLESAEVKKHPETEKIQDMKNKLDRANIKNDEATHLVKVYQQVVHLMDKQKLHYTPTLDLKVHEIAQKGRDISELTLIARDSRYSCSAAKNEYLRTKTEVNASSHKRSEVINQKKAQTMQNRQLFDPEQTRPQERTQQSLNSQPSVLRNKLNKAAREKREERFRQVSSTYDSIRDFFETTDPGKISKFFDDRRDSIVTLNRQIEDLKVQCSELQKKSDQLKSAIEEAEYASAKGVGCSRLLSEGENIHGERISEKKKEERALEAVAIHQKSVSAGCHHLHEVLSLVEQEGEDVPDSPYQVLQWCHEKVIACKTLLEEEDQVFLNFVNKPLFAAMKAREDSQFEGDDTPKKGKLMFKRAAKENKLDVQNRVMDRSTVKQLAAKTVQLHNQAGKKVAPSGISSKTGPSK